MNELCNWLAENGFTFASRCQEIVRFTFKGKETICVAYKGKFVIGSYDCKPRPPYDTIHQVIQEVQRIYEE